MDDEMDDDIDPPWQDVLIASVHEVRLELQELKDSVSDIAGTLQRIEKALQGRRSWF